MDASLSLQDAQLSPAIPMVLSSSSHISRAGGKLKVSPANVPAGEGSGDVQTVMALVLDAYEQQ